MLTQSCFTSATVISLTFFVVRNAELKNTLEAFRLLEVYGETDLSVWMTDGIVLRPR